MSLDVRHVLREVHSTLRVAPTYVALGLLKHVVPLATLVRWASRGHRVTTSAGSQHQVVRAVSRLQRWFGRGGDCVQCSLVLYRELLRRGANPVLAVGFRRDARGVEGHAWVSTNGRAVLNETYARPFTSVVEFGADGLPVVELERS